MQQLLPKLQLTIHITKLLFQFAEQHIQSQVCPHILTSCNIFLRQRIHPPPWEGRVTQKWDCKSTSSLSITKMYTFNILTHLEDKILHFIVLSRKRLRLFQLDTCRYQCWLHNSTTTLTNNCFTNRNRNTYRGGHRHRRLHLLTTQRSLQLLHTHRLHTLLTCHISTLVLCNTLLRWLPLQIIRTRFTIKLLPFKHKIHITLPNQILLLLQLQLLTPKLHFCTLNCKYTLPML